MRRFRIPLIAALATFVVLLAACGGSSSVDSGAGDATPGGGGDPLFVSIESGGGFASVGADVRMLPRAVVYADGASFTPAAEATMYPGSAVSSYVQGQLTEEQLDQLVEAASDAGLLADEPPQIGDPNIADAPTTTITVVVDGQPHVTSVYALEVPPLPGSPAASALPGLTDDQRAAREQIQAFVDLTSELATKLDGDLYPPERYRVLPIEPQEPVPGVTPDEADWPLPYVELVPMTCVAVEGEQADELGAALAEASHITRWRTDDGQLFGLAVRPLLPHDPGCPAGDMPTGP
jgi:hypothetical protein